jgi:hypothetical protein
VVAASFDDAAVYREPMHSCGFSGGEICLNVRAAG